MKPDKYWKIDYIDVKYYSPRELLEQIQEALDKYGEEFVSFDVSVEYDYGDSKATAYLECRRPPTEQEKTKDIEKERKQNDVNQEYEFKQYLALKKKFES